MLGRFIRCIIVGVIICFSVSILADVNVIEDDIQKSILALLTKQGPKQKNIIWWECGKKIKGENAQTRSRQYAEAIVASIHDVSEKTDELVNPDHVVALIYRESSCNECVIGRQETNRLTEQLGRTPRKIEMIRHVKRWSGIYFSAQQYCRKAGKTSDSSCVKSRVGKFGKEYAGIRGWDLGAAQYRWPGAYVRRRVLWLPSWGEAKKIELNDLFDYQISIQMLVEDLAHYSKVCRKHKHWIYSKWGHKKRILDSEEAYFVHHHMGEGRWSEKYWRAVNRHLKVIQASRQEVEDTETVATR